jgi:hypothetical protein
MPLTNDETAITPGIDVSSSEGVLLYGSDPTNAARQIKTNVDGNIVGEIPGDHAQSFSPDPSNHVTGTTPRNRIDISGNTMIRGQVLSDEGSLRDDFPGSSLFTNLTGTITFTNGSATVTGSGTAFLSELTTQNYIKATAHAETALGDVDSVESDTSLTLAAPYTGATVTTTGHKTLWLTQTPGAGGAAITVGSSEVSLAVGTSNGSALTFHTNGDYPPYTLTFKARITQRITNQTTYVGFADDLTTASPGTRAVVVFDGVDNTQIKFRTASSSNASDVEETLITLPNGLLTSTSTRYEIGITSTAVLLIINGSTMARHMDHIPGPYDVLDIGVRIENAAAVTATTFAIDNWMFFNVDQTQITNSFRGDPVQVQIVQGLSTSNTGIASGFIGTAATTQVAVRNTTYTEQTANAQRSIVSTSANDAAAGTGARTVRIIYYTAAFLGPYTEILTMNGLTPVNTVNTDICYIEKMEILTVGSNNFAVGTINLKAAAAGAGATIGSITAGAAGDNTTFWAHHYVATGRFCFITGMSAAHTGNTTTSGGLFVLKIKQLGITNAAENQVADFLRSYGQSSTTQRNYGTPIKIFGPARIVMYVSPEAATANTMRGAFDFYDQ